MITTIVLLITAGEFPQNYYSFSLLSFGSQKEVPFANNYKNTQIIRYFGRLYSSRHNFLSITRF